MRKFLSSVLAILLLGVLWPVFAGNEKMYEPEVGQKLVFKADFFQPGEADSSVVTTATITHIISGTIFLGLESQLDGSMVVEASHQVNLNMMTVDQALAEADSAPIFSIASVGSHCFNSMVVTIPNPEEGIIAVKAWMCVDPERKHVVFPGFLRSQIYQTDGVVIMNRLERIVLKE